MDSLAPVNVLVKGDRSKCVELVEEVDKMLDTAARKKIMAT